VFFGNKNNKSVEVDHLNEQLITLKQEKEVLNQQLIAQAETIRQSASCIQGDKGEMKVPHGVFGNMVICLKQLRLGSKLKVLPQVQRTLVKLV